MTDIKVLCLWLRSFFNEPIHDTRFVQAATAIEEQAAEIERLKAERDGLRAALRQIWFLDHNERDWESVDEIKAFAKDTLKREGE